MTDVRAILEEQSELHRRRVRMLKRASLGFALIFVALGAIQLFRGKPPEDLIRLFFPLIFFGGFAAAFTPRHLQALQDAIADPDPALDPRFAEVLTTSQLEVAALGRRSFLERFAHRLPELDDAGWVAVASALPQASPDEAERMLALLKGAGSYATVAPLEAFSVSTKEDRLATASLAALGEIRHRTARDKVLQASHDAEMRKEDAHVRLGL